MFSYALKFIKNSYPQKIALNGALIFFLFSLAWILFSDRIAAYFFSDAETLTTIQSLKGIVYISITSLLVYVLILRPMQSQVVLLQQIQANETRLRAILDHSPSLISIQDIEGKISLVNKQFERAYKNSSESLIDRNIHEIFPEDIAQFRILKDSEVLETGKPTDIEETLKHQDGSYHSYITIKFPVAIPGQAPYGICSVSTDISERVKAQKDLKEHQEKLKHTLNRLNESERIGKNGTWEYDCETKEIWWSESMHEIFDVPMDEIPTQDTYMQRIHPDDQANVVKSFTRAAHSNAQQAELTYRIIVHSDQIKYIWVNYRIERDKNGAALFLAGTAKNITEQKQTEEKIYYLAYYDDLTGLPNRTLLLEDLSHELNQQKESHWGAVIQLDLDHFKTINECLGHKLGDILLKQVGQRIQSTQPETQKVYYVGGDEFYILIPDIAQTQHETQELALTIAESVRQNLSKPYYIQNSKLYLSASFGVILFPESNSNADDLLKCVDIALSLAKKRGRNTIELYHESFQKDAQIRLAMEIDLREAIEQEEFLLYYQPQVDKQGNFIGAETLLRWQHPQHGMVPPNDFIPLAEKTGMILPIGEKVLMMACRQIRIWEEQGYFNDLLKHISVNVSPRQFHQDNFETYIHMLLNVTGIQANHLMLELTESVVIDNFERTIEKMNSIKKLGIHFSMDDFGTGYSSLSYLRRLPFDELKIDRSFVMDISIDGSGKAIAESIISIAKNLQMEVVAEGVELNPELDFLTSHGCLKFQGFLFAKPMPIDAFNQVIKLQVKV